MDKSIAIKTASLIAACGLMMISTSASAGVHWSVNVGVPIGVPPPVYVQPAPVYVQPQPVYVQPQPVYVQPAPVYGVVYYDAWGRPYYHHRHHHHGW